MTETITQQLSRESHQRHHDYYVALRVEGGLQPEDERQYNLAIQREQAGLVKKLVVNEQLAKTMRLQCPAHGIAHEI